MHAHKGPAACLILALVATLIGGQTLRADDSLEQKKAAITKTAEAFIEAFHKGDAAALAAFWTPDGDYMDMSGRVIQGRKAIEHDFAEQFAQVKGLKLRIEVHSIRFPSPDTAVEDGVTSVLMPGSALPVRTHYTNFFVNTGGRWLLTSVRESAFSPPNNYERLRPLEWVIGEWEQDTKDGMISRVVFQWTPDQNYIIATHGVEADGTMLDNGMQRIGWDPAAKVIRTWTFEADGGFSEGSWTKVNNQWINNVSTVLRSGSLMTAAHIITMVDENTITVQSKNQQMDGNPLPDSAPITMKRVN